VRIGVFFSVYKGLLSVCGAVSWDTLQRGLQGGEDSQDPLSCRSFPTKEPLNICHFCGK